MATAFDVVVRFLADSTSVQKEVAKVEGTGKKLKSWAKGVGLAIGGAFAVKAIKDFVNAAEEAEAVSRGLKQVLKNAGDETGKWAAHAEDLADAMARKTGIDDETIKKGQTILATFHNLSGETAQTSGAFDRATKAAVDLSKAGFGDVDSAAKALGKALEDPEKGIAALAKAGVQFDPIQKAQIKAFLDAGDQASAMNIILGEVESQVGGTAEATATASGKMNVAWGETQEAIGRALLPILQVLAPLLETIAGFIEQNANAIVPLVGAIIAWTAATKALNAVLLAFNIEAGIAVGWLALIVVGVAALIAVTVLLYAKWNQVWTFIGNLPWYARVGILIAALTNPISLIILAVATLAVYWDRIWGAISNIVQRAVGFIGGWIDDLVSAFHMAVSAAEKLVDVLGKIKRAAESSPLPFGLNVPGVPFLGAGGIVTRPTLAMIGEAGPEAVIPLTRAGASSGGGGNVIINVHTTGLGADAPAIQSAVVTALRQYTTRNGPLPAGIVG